MKKLHTCKAKGTAAVAGLLAALCLALACNKPFPDTLDPNTEEPPLQEVTQRTLLIVVDGAVGTEVQAAQPPTLNSLVDFSIFSWEGLSGYKNTELTNALTWTTLLTGTGPDKHGVTGPDFTGNNLAVYPSLFTRLKQERPGVRTAAICASADLVQYLTADATEKKVFPGDDAAVKKAVLDELSGAGPSLLLAQFGDVDRAGAASSYSASAPEYKAAILRIDGYIGEILAALRARPSFRQENWMVILTSNKGSNTPYRPATTPWSAFEDRRYNTFFFCYNPRFKSQNPGKPAVVPYIGSAPYYSGTQSLNRRAKVLDGGTTYDMGSSGSYTIQCKVKVPTGNYYYPAFLSKRASFSPGVAGWVFFLEGNYWQINFGQSGMGNRQVRGHAIADGQWHTLTAVIKQEGAARNVYTYTDGVLYPFTGNRDISGYGNLNSPQPLTTGNLPPDNVTNLQNYLITDIRVYNTALPGDYLANNFCKTEVEASDPYRGNLLGFWSSRTVTPDKRIPDESGRGHDLVIESYNPAAFSDITTRVCPAISEEVYRTVPNGVDVAVQIYQWLGLAVPPAWGLDGKNWVPVYSDLGD